MKEDFIEGWSAKREIFQFDPSLRECRRNSDQGSGPIGDRNADPIDLRIDADGTCGNRFYDLCYSVHIDAGAQNDIEPVATYDRLEFIRGALGNDTPFLEHADTMSKLIGLLKILGC